MLFKPELAAKIVTGEKTQTRRPVRPGDELYEVEFVNVLGVTHNGRRKWEECSDYAVQYGRGKPTRWYRPATGHLLSYEDYVALSGHVPVGFPDPDLRERGFLPLRIQIMAIYREDVRKISHEDAIAEGFNRPDAKYAFLQTWCSFYSPSVLEQLRLAFVDMPAEYCPDFLWERPAHHFDAWVLEFRLKETEP